LVNDFFDRAPIGQSHLASWADLVVGTDKLFGRYSLAGLETANRLVIFYLWHGFYPNHL
jgi:hypothetical protein